MMKNLFHIFYFVLSTSIFNLSAQDVTIDWTDISSSYSLPNGAKIFEGERANPLLKAWYLDIDMNNSEIAVRPYISPTNLGIVPFVQSVGVFAAINGGYFGGSTSYSTVVYPKEVKAQNISTVYRGGVPYDVTRSFFGISDGSEVSVDWIFHYGKTISTLYTFSLPSPNAPGNPAPSPR
jgi:hypothetical protein